MSMSLDYMGRFALILIAVAVGVGLIMTLQGDIGDWVPDDVGDDERVDSEVVNAQTAGDIANLVTLCYQESRERPHESFVCFIARHDSGTFGFGPGDVNTHLGGEQEAATRFEGGCCDGDSVVIRYDVADEEVVVEN